MSYYAPYVTSGESAIASMVRTLNQLIDNLIDAGVNPVDGSVTDDAVAADAAIAQSKINGLVAALNALTAADTVRIANTQTTDYTLVLADAGKAVEINAATAKNVTVPPNSSVAFPVGTIIEIPQVGTGAATLVAGAGVTITGDTVTPGQGGSLLLRKTATNAWWSAIWSVRSGTYVQVPDTAGLDFQQVLVPDSSMAEGVRWAFLSAAGLVPNVKDFAATGAQRAVLGNNTLKPLSGFYGSLGAAQAAYPHVTALSQELDWAVGQAGINATASGFLYWPPGTYFGHGYAWKANLLGLGAGRIATTLRSVTGDLMTVAGTHFGFYQMGFDSTGHIFTQSGNVASSELVSCKFLQRTSNKSIWKNNGFGYIDMLVLSFWQQVASDMTVPAWDLVSENGDVNRNTWQQGFHTYSFGAPVWKLDSASAASFLYDNVWRDIVFEIAVGGGIWLGGCLDPVVENCAIWDTPNATADFISVGPGTGGLRTQGGTFRKLGRRSSTFTGSFGCWASRNTSGGLTCHFEGCDGTSGGAPFTVDLNNTTGHTAVQGVFNTFTNGTPDFAVAASTLAAKQPIVETVNTVPASGAAQTIPDPTTATINRITLTANCTFTFPTAAAGKSFTLALLQGGAGGWTATWPGTVKWPSGVAPTLSTASAKIDYLTFVCTDGTNWAGFVAGIDLR